MSTPNQTLDLAEQAAVALGAEERDRLITILKHLWWVEYDSTGTPIVFDRIEEALRILGADLPNAAHGGREPKWGKDGK